MLLLTQNDDTEISECLEAQLAQVEQRFAAELISELPCVNSLVSHVERYHGKMLRPVLVLVSGMAASPHQQGLNEGHTVVATVVEMVHMATLVHDDILDDAQVRRGGATINHLKGNEAAVMLGDYLISHAYHLCSSLDSAWPSRVIADTTNTVCEGELLQLSHRGDYRLDEATYFEIIRRKTGSLCGACCRLGAVLSEASPQVAQSFYDYGMGLGVAFQIIDDLLDLTGMQRTVGKTLGRDLQKGKMTLPLIHFLRSCSDTQRSELIGLLEHPDAIDATDTSPPAYGRAVLTNTQRAQAVRGLIASNGSVDYANDWASRLIEQAKQSLADLEPSPALTLLTDIADAVLTRDF